MLTASVLTAGSSSITRTRPAPACCGTVIAFAERLETDAVSERRQADLDASCRSPSFDSTATNPPWFLMIECEVARPRPLPFCLVLK